MSCNVCLEPADQSCSKCLTISYPSQDNQHSTDWSGNKSNSATESNVMSSGCSSNINQSEKQSSPTQQPESSSSSQEIFSERLQSEATPIDESFDYTNHSHNNFRNLTGNTMSIGEVNMVNPTGGPNLNFK